MSAHTWRVPATVVRVVDGDTLALRLDLGWHIYLDARCRLIGCNAPEMVTDEGKAARAWVVDMLHGLGADMQGAGAEVTFISHALDKYGRPLGQVLITTPQGDTIDLGGQLIAAGHAVPM